MRWVVIALGMPNHSQDERRQAKRLGTGGQIEAFAKPLYYRLLNAGYKVARCDCMQDRKTVRKRQPQSASQSSRGEFVVDQSPSWLR